MTSLSLPFMAEPGGDNSPCLLRGAAAKCDAVRKAQALRLLLVTVPKR